MAKENKEYSAQDKAEFALLANKKKPEEKKYES